MADGVRRRSHAVRWLVGVVVVVALGVAGRELRAIDAEAAELRTATSQVAGQADRLDEELAAARSSLSRQRVALVDAENGLRWAEQGSAVSEAEHAAVVAELEEAERLLQSIEAALGDTAQSARATTALVDALGSCLDGVSELLVQLSVGDQLGAIVTLGGVDDVCDAVGLVLG